jgi:hypothetical protein
LAPEDRRHELVQSRTVLETALGVAVTGFSYPWGEVDGPTARAVEEAGYAYACTVRPTGVNGRYALARRNVDRIDGPLRLSVKFALNTWAQSRAGGLR